MRLRPIRPTATIKRKKPTVQLNATATRTASRRGREEDFEDDEEEYYEASEPNMKLSHAFIVVLILHLIAVAGIFGFNSLKTRQSSLAKISEEAAAPSVANSAANSSAAIAADTTASSPAAAATASAQTRGLSGTSHTVVPGDTLTRIARQHGTSIEALEAANGLTSESILRVGQVLNLPEPGAAAPASAQSAPPAPSTQPSAPAQKAAAAPAVAKTTTASPSAPSAPATTAKNNAPATPATSAPAASGATAKTPAASSTSEVELYEVVAGDNPYSIAKRLGVSYQSLIEFNQIEDPTKLQIGQKLKVPR